MTEPGSIREQTPPHEYYLNLARTLPRIPVDDQRMQAILGAQDKARQDALYSEHFGQFGNNFHFLFEGLKLRRAGIDLDPDDFFYRLKVVQAEALGKPWETFLAQNDGLLAEIDTVLDQGRPLEEFYKYLISLMNSNHADDLDALREAIGHPLGIRALLAAYQDKRIPLFKAAARAMQDAGINPEEFYT